MIRKHFLNKINDQLRIHPVCALLGPRQVGKTTMARHYAEEHFPGGVHFIDLDDPIDLARLENPMLTLTSITERLIVIDEIQKRPELFPILRVLVDRQALTNKKTRKQSFLVLGSASRDLIRQSSESLAGRIGYIELYPFSLFEVKESSKLWVRGGFPKSYLADSDSDSYLWRQSYIKTFLEQDIPNLGFHLPPEQLRRFWLMLAHYHGQTLNISELSKSLTVSQHTIKKYLDILTGTFMIRSLTPWFENIGKRQVKSPKIYFRDTGILNTLVGIQDATQLQVFPRLGSFWEGFALEEIIRTFQANQEEAYWWATQAGAKLDLLIIKNGKRLGFEVKYTDSPRTSKSMHSALADLKLDHLGIIYPGKKIFPLTDKITAYGLDTLGTGEFHEAYKAHYLLSA